MYICLEYYSIRSNGPGNRIDLYPPLSRRGRLQRRSRPSGVASLQDCNYGNVTDASSINAKWKDPDIMSRSKWVSTYRKLLFSQGGSFPRLFLLLFYVPDRRYISVFTDIYRVLYSISISLSFYLLENVNTALY